MCVLKDLRKSIFLIFLVQKDLLRLFRGNPSATGLLNPEDEVCVKMVLKYIEDLDLRQWIPNINAFRIGLNEWRSKLNCITNPYMYEQGVRVDGNSNLSDEIGKQLSVRSAAAGLRPIGAVIHVHQNNLKMCLRSIDSATDTSEIAKAHKVEAALQVPAPLS